MERGMEELEWIPWAGFTLITALALGVNGAKALAGAARFAWWHLPTLWIGSTMTLESLTAGQRARLKAAIKDSMKAAKVIVEHLVSRAARGLAALLTVNQDKQIQTEP